MTETTVEALNCLVRTCDAAYRLSAKTLGIPDSSMDILYALEKSREPVGQQALCSMVFHPKQTVNSALKKLEKEGYLQILPGKDRRSSEICLTERGRELQKTTSSPVLSAEYRAMETLTEEEQAQLLRLYGCYARALTQELMNIKEEKP